MGPSPSTRSFLLRPTFITPTNLPFPDSSSVFGFFNNTVTNLLTAHLSLDDHLASWFVLNHSKYQWALDDYYQTKAMEKGDIRVKEVSSKAQSI